MTAGAAPAGGHASRPHALRAGSFSLRSPLRQRVADALDRRRMVAAGNIAGLVPGDPARVGHRVRDDWSRSQRANSLGSQARLLSLRGHPPMAFAALKDPEEETDDRRRSAG